MKEAIKKFKIKISILFLFLSAILISIYQGIIATTGNMLIEPITGRIYIDGLTENGYLIIAAMFFFFFAIITIISIYFTSRTIDNFFVFLLKLSRSKKSN